MFFGACMEDLGNLSFLHPWRAWHAWVGMELLIPNVFLWVNIDLTPVVYHKHTQSAEIWATQDCCLYSTLRDWNTLCWVLVAVVFNHCSSKHNTCVKNAVGTKAMSVAVKQCMSFPCVLRDVSAS